MKNTWEKVGVIGVDAGLIWIGDPCYVVTPDATEHPAKTWGAFIDELYASGSDFPKTGVKQYNYKMGHPGLGVLLSTGGDWTFDVFVRRLDDGMIAEAKVVFSPK